MCLSLVPACHVSRLQVNSILSRSAVSQPFWHQGLVLWKTIFPQTGLGDGRVMMLGTRSGRWSFHHHLPLTSCCVARLLTGWGLGFGDSWCRPGYRVDFTGKGITYKAKLSRKGRSSQLLYHPVEASYRLLQPQSGLQRSEGSLPHDTLSKCKQRSNLISGRTNRLLGIKKTWKEFKN